MGTGQVMVDDCCVVLCSVATFKATQHAGLVKKRMRFTAVHGCVAHSSRQAGRQVCIFMYVCTSVRTKCGTGFWSAEAPFIVLPMHGPVFCFASDQVG
jgi:hypothetical protein